MHVDLFKLTKQIGNAKTKNRAYKLGPDGPIPLSPFTPPPCMFYQHMAAINHYLFLSELCIIRPVEELLRSKDSDLFHSR